MKIDRKFYWDSVKKTLLAHPTQSQVDGTETLLAAFEAVNWPVPFMSYGLATAWHETDETMQPIDEKGGDAYFTRLYDIKGTRPDLAKQNGNVHPGDGPKFHGRGFVQLTWFNNYLRAGKAIGVDLVGNPDLAKQTDIAAKVMVYGMSQGWFTGRKLSDYLVNGKFDPVNARRIINGLDRANDIALYYDKFVPAFRAA